MIPKTSNRLRTRRLVLAAAGSSVILFAHYLRNTETILGNAFDTSIAESENQKTKPPERKVITYIKAQTERGSTLLRSVLNFVKFNYAKRLIAIAQSDNRLLRVRAIDNLSRLHLDKWQYSVLALMCNAQMAVGLARRSSTAEEAARYFLPVQRNFVMSDNKFLVTVVKDYLRLLYIKSGRTHSCLQKSMSKIFLQAYDINRLIDNTLAAESCGDFERETEIMLPLYLETLRHHSSIPKFTPEILNHSGLHVLMEIYLRYKDDLNITIPICEILMHLSRNIHALEQVYNCGWVAILSQWSHHPDIRLSTPALQALSNFDQDCKEKFTQNLFLLHPRVSSNEQPLVDVVFVHGLLGSVFYTWRNGRVSCVDSIGKASAYALPEKEASSNPHIQEYLSQMAENEQMYWEDLGNDYEILQYDIPELTNEQAMGPYTIEQKDLKEDCQPTQCWARDWLPIDCAHLRILGVNYPTSLSLWAHMCPNIPHEVTLDQRTGELMKALKDAGVGKRPIVWVCHSMGGLLVKNAIGKAWESNDPSIKKLATQSRAIFFYSTPHSGSKTALFNPTTSYVVWPSMDVHELRENSTNLQRMHTTFLDYMDTLPIKVFSFVENKPTVVSALKLNVAVVERSSGDPGIGEFFEIPLNHLGICKPANRHSFLYQKVLKEIRNIVVNEKNN